MVQITSSVTATSLNQFKASLDKYWANQKWYTTHENILLKPENNNRAIVSSVV